MAFANIAPALIFPSLSALAFHFILGHFIGSGGGAQIEAQCPPNAGPYSLSYTGIASADGFLCFLVAFFHASFDSSLATLFREFGASWSVAVILPTIESSRHGCALIFTPIFPVVFGVLYQVLGAGIMYPFFWLATIYSGHARMRAGPHAKIDRASAEANLFALVVAYVMPSVIMFLREDPKITALWQPFPVWIALIRALYLLVRPRTRESGYATTQTTFLFTFLFSAVVHIANVWPLRHDAAALAYQFVPRVTVPDLATTTLPHAALVFLQWDMYFTLGSGLVGALWFAENARQFVGAALWSVGASLAFGTGAAMSGLLMWRERMLNGGGEGKRLKRGY